MAIFDKTFYRKIRTRFKTVLKGADKAYEQGKSALADFERLVKTQKKELIEELKPEIEAKITGLDALIQTLQGILAKWGKDE